MARIRTIKPEFFRHEGLFELERETGFPVRLAFAGLWSASDREGRFKWAPKSLKLDCLPFDECDFSRVLDALWTRGFIVKYALDGREFGHIPSWHEHQVINNRESASTLPDPAECSIISTTSTRDARVNDAKITPLVQDQGEGKEINVALRARREQVAAVFDHWRLTMNHQRSVLDDKRRKLIEARMKDGYSIDDLKAAITGCSLSPFHMGQNEQGARYDGLELILRDGSKVDKFLATYRTPPRPLGKQGQIEARNQAAVDEFLAGDAAFGQGPIIDMEADYA